MKLLIWDFDGTLGYRDGGAWTASAFEVVQQVAPQRVAPAGPVTYEALQSFMRAEFPWLKPEEPHLELDTADAWWAALAPVFERAYRGVGFAADEARHLASRVRSTYLATPERWRAFDDVVPVLETLADAGWSHAMLTNHVPELPDIVRWVGLTPYFTRIFNSAEIGYEKPHPCAFQTVMKAMGVPDTCWMIGDSYEADVVGAETVGIPAILVRRPHPKASRYAETLWDVPRIVSVTA